jgi:hypothetical protein
MTIRKLGVKKKLAKKETATLNAGFETYGKRRSDQCRNKRSWQFLTQR